jgi:hypothetical protein
VSGTRLSFLKRHVAQRLGPIGLGLCATTAFAQDPQPPVWPYLAECSAVFRAVSQASDGYAAPDPQIFDAAATVADRFLTRATEAAAEAGEADPQADVESVMVYLIPRWEGRIDRLFSVPTNLEWIDYCRQLGLVEGVLPLTDG